MSRRGVMDYESRHSVYTPQVHRAVTRRPEAVVPEIQHAHHRVRRAVPKWIRTRSTSAVCRGDQRVGRSFGHSGVSSIGALPACFTTDDNE